ncbi:hypothetical protein DFJ74DRAFT_708563 [Hyaloraphidium curvatum]|nr:hypothetical protein DFJ74DRAFT_708563 [Hyaloraphidium curvatum]
MDSQAGRAALDKCFVSFVAVDSGLAAVASIVADLNAFSTRKVEEPDFDRRFAAFSDISERRYGELSPEEWIPVLRNLVSSVRHEKEFSMRTNAAFCLVKLVDRASETVQEGGDTAFRDLVVFVLLPAIKASMERGSEAVRNEHALLGGREANAVAVTTFWAGMDIVNANTETAKLQSVNPATQAALAANSLAIQNRLAPASTTPGNVTTQAQTTRVLGGYSVYDAGTTAAETAAREPNIFPAGLYCPIGQGADSSTYINGVESLADKSEAIAGAP